jgi:hypothetical protein
VTELINSPGNEVPDWKLLVIPYQDPDVTIERIENILKPLAGEKQRDWYDPHFYRCLPMLIGNQYGFALYAEKDFSVIWNGGNKPEDTKITIDEAVSGDIQHIKSHFGYGTITIENRWLMRTPPGVNFMTVQTPNVFKRGVHMMTGVIETDNLRRNFIFNLKITEPNHQIFFQKGEMLASFILLPRYYVDKFSIAYANDIYSREQIDLEFMNCEEHGRLRESPDSPENHYRRGVDAFENPFPDHQSFIKKPRNESAKHD